MEQEKIQQLEQRIVELEKVLKEHQHLGKDGSKEFDGITEINARSVSIHGAGIGQEGFIALPNVIYDSGNKGEDKRGVATGIAVLGKGTLSEQIQLHLLASYGFDENQVVSPNRTDWDKYKYSDISLTYIPNYNTAFLIANSSPAISSTGTLLGNELIDNTANFSNLAGNYLVILNTSQSAILEVRKILSNTNTTITVDTFSNSGTYPYQVVNPVNLGSATVPFKTFYVGDNIRLGYGSSTGSQVQYIKWGAGTPEGVVTANPGSLYLRNDGGAGTSMYIKETGTGNTGWATMGTTSGWTGGFREYNGGLVDVVNGVIRSVT